MKKMKERIQEFLDSDASAMQIVISKFELEQMGINAPNVPESTGLLLSFQYISLDLDDEERDKQQLKLSENKN